MGEIDAGGKYPSTGILRVVDAAAAQHRDLRAGVENGEIDRGLEGRQRRLVESVENRRISQLDNRRLVHAAHERGTEIDRSLPREAREQVERFRPRKQHRLAQVPAELGMRQDMREQDAVVDLEAFLVLEGSAFSAARAALIGREPRQKACSIADEPLDAHERAPARGEPAVERFHMGCQETFAKLPLLAVDGVARRGLVGVASRLAGKLRAQRCCHTPECRARFAIEPEAHAELGLGAQPRAHIAGGEPGSFEECGLIGGPVGRRLRNSCCGAHVAELIGAITDPQGAGLAVSSSTEALMRRDAAGEELHEARHVHLPPVRPRADRDGLARRDRGAADRTPQAHAS